MQFPDTYPPWYSNLPSWWNPTCTKHLLVGVFKHGYGRFLDIANDEDLCFSKYIAETMQQYKDDEEQSSFLEELDDQDDPEETRTAIINNKNMPKGLEAPILNKLLIWILEEESTLRAQKAAAKVKECDMDGEALQAIYLDKERLKKTCQMFTVKEKKELFSWGRKIGGPKDARHYLRDCRQLDFHCLSWALVGKLMRSARSGEELSAYFEAKLLPYCRKLVASQAAVEYDPDAPLVHLTKKKLHELSGLFIDVGAPLESNSPVMIELAASLLKRTAIYRHACSVLVDRHEALGHALR